MAKLILQDVQVHTNSYDGGQHIKFVFEYPGYHPIEIVASEDLDVNYILKALDTNLEECQDVEDIQALVGRECYGRIVTDGTYYYAPELSKEEFL